MQREDAIKATPGQCTAFQYCSTEITTTFYEAFYARRVVQLYDTITFKAVVSVLLYWVTLYYKVFILLTHFLSVSSTIHMQPADLLV